MFRTSKIIEYITVFTLTMGGVFWIRDTVATKTDVLIAMNTIESGRIASDMVYYERIGTDHLQPADKERFKVLRNEERANEAQYKRLLGLD